MKAWDYNAVIFEGEVYCVDCLPCGPANPGTPIFSVEEWDYYPVCTVCGTEHDYIGLTDYGREQNG